MRIPGLAVGVALGLLLTLAGVAIIDVAWAGTFGGLGVAGVALVCWVGSGTRRASAISAAVTVAGASVAGFAMATKDPAAAFIVVGLSTIIASVAVLPMGEA